MHVVDGVVSSGAAPFFLHGHYPLSFANSCYPGAHFKSFTFLRKPRKRLISQYNFDRDFLFAYPNKYEASLHEAMFSLPPEDFVRSANIWYYDNCSVRLLSNDWNHIPFGMLTSEHLNEAKRNLNKLLFVGFYETLQDSCNELASRLALPSLYLNHRNATKPTDPTLGAWGHSPTLNSLLELDEELYSFAMLNQK